MRRLLAGLIVVSGVLVGVTPSSAHQPVARAVVTVRHGDDSLRVAEIQQQLKKFGYSVEVDGVFGQQTLGAVLHFQKSNALLADGIVGARTRQALGLAVGKSVNGLPAATPAPTHSTVTPEDTPSKSPASGGASVETIIRDVWPDDLEDWAVRIATRESRLQPDVRNACCWGLFQIHWTAHRSWLTSDYGITNPEQLYDAHLNATVALALYQATGPGPWNL